MNKEITKIYTCPMHPHIEKKEPGICPECGMNLVPREREEKKGKKEYEKHAGHSVEMFAKKFWVSLVLTLPVILFSDLAGKLFSFQFITLTWARYLSLIFSSIVFFYGGWIFIEGARRELKAKLPGMMTLIALAISTAYLYSFFIIIIRREGNLFWELTTLITIMLLGHWLEMRAVQGTMGALKELAKLLPDTAEVLKGEKTEIIPLNQLKVGDIFLVRPGGKIPADGLIIEGKSEINESMVTGESKPVKKSVGNEVIAGTINGEGSLKIKVTKIGEDTFLAGVMRLVVQAQASKSRLQILADRAAFYLTIIAVTTGTITFIAWVLTKAGVAFAIERLVAVLVIACPHALGLAIPLVASISTTLAAKNGFLVKQRLALEAAREINVVLFDKTGTLTKGEFGIEKIWPMKENENELLKIATSLEKQSEHFIARAIVKEAQKRKLQFFEAKSFSSITGKGTRGFVEGKITFIGGSSLLKDYGIEIPEWLKKEIEEEGQKGKTIIFVFREKEPLGAISLGDVVREESRETIKELKRIGLKVAMITGDTEDVATWVAKELEIDEYFARVLPQEKSEKVKILQKRGLKVAVVGDGVNDAPALMQADLGIAIGAGTNVAIESAGIILVRNDPRDIIKIIRLSKATFSKMIQNLFWATGYNVVSLPLATGILAFRGILLQPALAAVFMSLSTVIVAINALFLRKIKL